MSDKRVPAESDEPGAELPADESYQDRDSETDDLVEEAISDWGEPHNRDEDEFTSKGLKTPNVVTDLPEVQDQQDKK